MALLCLIYSSLLALLWVCKRCFSEVLVLRGMLCLICIWIVVLSLRSLPGMCARENFARAELLCLERVIGGEREFQISWMQKQLPQT